MPNAWVMHVKKWAAENNKSYGCAVSDPECKATYRKPIKEKPLTKKQKQKNLENEAREMQMMEQEEKTQKQIQKKIAQNKREKEEEEMMKYYEEEREKEKNNSLYLTDYLDIKIVKKESGIQPEEMIIYNKIFNLINNHFKTGDVLKRLNDVEFTYSAQEYILNWLQKKENAGHSAELSDFIKLVVFPRLKKDNPNIDNITLILEAINISTDLKKMIDDKTYGQETQFNSYRITKAFMDYKISNVYSVLNKNIKGLSKALIELVIYNEGPVAGKITAKKFGIL